MRSKAWIARSNIEMFKQKIAEAKGDGERAILRELLAKEEQKLRELEAVGESD